MEESESLDAIKQKYPLERIKEIMLQFKKRKVLTIGEVIIDEYHFTIPKGRAIKDPILSVDYLNHDVYPGGILAVTNHLSDFVGEILCVTALGDHADRKDFVESSLPKNVTPKFFVKKDSPTIVKKRFLDSLRNVKLFKVEYMNDTPISEDLEREFIAFLEQEVPKYDIVMVGDFGHGLITDNIIKVLEAKAKYLAVNAQSNSANLGFNYVTKYSNPSYITMDMNELQYAVSDRFSPMPVLIQKLSDKTGFKKFLITMGKGGSAYFNNGKLVFSPAFITTPKDTVGAGDAVFSVTSLFAFLGMDDLIPFTANCSGGVAVSYLGNEKSVNKQNLLEFMENAYTRQVKSA